MSMQVPRLALSYASYLGGSTDMCPREARFELRLPCRDLPSSNLTPLVTPTINPRADMAYLEVAIPALRRENFRLRRV